MKISFLSRHSLVILGAALLAGNTNQAQAQTAAPAATVGAAQTQTIEIPVYDVNANAFAFWFNSLPRTLPADAQLNDDNKNFVQNFPWGALMDEKSRNAQFPAGIASIAGAPDDKTLTATGTVAGLQALKQRVTELDVPLRFVEIDVQTLSISPANLNALKIPFGALAPADANGNINAGDQGKPITQFGFVPGNLTAKINDLLSKNEVHLISGSRSRIINGLTGTLESRRTTKPIAKSTTADSISQSQGQTGKDSRGMGASQTVESGFKATPTIKDGFIAVDFQITLDDSLTQMSAIFNDGQTLVVKLHDAKVEPGKVAIALVTARIPPPNEGVQTK